MVGERFYFEIQFFLPAFAAAGVPVRMYNKVYARAKYVNFGDHPFINQRFPGGRGSHLCHSK